MLRAPIAIITISAAGVIQVANRAALALLAYDMEELGGRPFAHLLVGPARSRWLALWARPGADPVMDLEVRCVCGDAREIDVYVSVSFDQDGQDGQDAEGEAERVVIAALRPVDAAPGGVSARERALRARLDALETMIEQVPIGLYEARADGEPATVFVNAGVTDQIGHPPEDILQDPTFWSRHLHPDERASVYERAERAFYAGQGRYEYRFLQKDGTYRWIQDALRVIPGTGDTLPRIVGCCMDITARKLADTHIRELNQRLEQQNRELEWFSYSVSHDLRAPLRAIDGFSTALLEDHGGRLDGSGRELLDRVCSAAQHMAQLIDGLLGLAHISRSELCREQLDLSALAHEIAEGLAAAEPAREVRWLVAPGVTGCGDRRLLRILLDNVLGNAWKYTAYRADACIEIGALDRAGTRVYFVRDNGVGFDMAHTQGLFKPFHRLHSAREFAGTGIGLATALRVLERHGGRMWAEGAVGKGATFYFTLSP